MCIKNNAVKHCIPEYGDFSFMKDSIERRSMEIDLNVLEEKNININLKEKITWDTPPIIQDWDIINSKLYQCHTYESYDRNIKNIAFIKQFGWNCFVKNYPLRFE